MLAASLVGMGFYTTCTAETVQVPDGQLGPNAKAKAAVDDFCGVPPKGINLDNALFRMAKRMIACGNVFWLKISDTEIIRLPVDAVDKIILKTVNNTNIKIPYKVTGYKLKAKYGGGTLEPEKVIHWKLEEDDETSGFGIGLMQTLLLTLTIQGCEKRPSYAAMKAKIEAIMPKILRNMLVLMFWHMCLALLKRTCRSGRALSRTVRRKGFISSMRVSLGRIMGSHL